MLQCRLPADLPSDSLVVVTYNSSYMADMKTANVQRRSPPHQYSTVQYSTVQYSHHLTTPSIAPHLLTDC